MRPLSLRLTNCRTFADLDLPIPEGVTAILGNNGVGKSTLLCALDVALFAERGELAGELSYGEDALRIELIFNHDETLYRVRRSYDGRGRGKSLLDFDELIGGEWEAQTLESIDATQARIRETVGFSREILRSSAFLGQNTHDSILDLPPAQRKQRVSDVLGLDVYRERHKTAQAALSEAKNEGIRLRERAAGLQVVVDGRPAAETALAAAAEEDLAVDLSAMAAEQDLALARDALASQQAAIERVRTADAEHRAAVAQVRERERLIAEQKSLDGQAVALIHRAEHVEQHRDGLCDRCNQTISTATARVHTVQSLRREAEALFAQCGSAGRRVAQLPQDATAAADRLAEARAAAGDAATLAQAVRDAETRVRAARAALDAVRARIVRAEAEIERCQQAEVGLAQVVDQMSTTAARVDLLALAEKMYGPAGIPVLIAENAIPLIEQEANRILAMMPTADGETFYTELHTQREQKSVAHARETLDVVVHGDTGPRLYDADRRTHSGGESSRLRLAFALGLAALIARRTRVEFLVVDELPYLDTLGQEQLVAVLQSLEDTYGCVLVVAHEAMLASSFDRTLVVERSGGRARIAGAVEAVPA